MTRSRMYGPDRDPVARHVGEPWIDRALRKVLNAQERRLLTDCLWGAPPDQMGRRLGIGGDDVLRLVAALLHRIKESRYGPALMEELRSGSGPRFSALLWEGRKEVPVHRCARAGCTEPPFIQRDTGRARRYCSNRCKQAAYRERRRQDAAESPAVTQRSSLTNPSRGYLLRQYSELPELPEPQQQQSWFLGYIERRMHYAAHPPVTLLPQGRTGRPAPMTFLAWPHGSGKGVGLLALAMFDAQTRYLPRAHRLASARVVSDDAYFAAHSRRWFRAALERADTAGTPQPVEPSRSLTSPMEVLLPWPQSALGWLPTAPLPAMGDSRAQGFWQPSTSGPLPHARRPSARVLGRPPRAAAAGGRSGRRWLRSGRAARTTGLFTLP